MVPFVKFGLFDTDLDTNISEVEQNVNRVTEHLQKWKNFLSQTNRHVHSIRISHTDQDMLTIAFKVKFSKPTSLEKIQTSGINDYMLIAESEEYAAVPEFPVGTLVLLVGTLSAYIGITRYSGRIIPNLISITNLK